MATETNAIASQPVSATNLALPGRLSSSSFAPATSAAQIGRLNPEVRDKIRADLLSVRDNLGEKLGDRVPAWPEFRAIVENISSSLALTQQASTLLSDVNSLATSTYETSRPQTTIDALNETERIASNMRLLDQVKSVAEQMQQLKDREAKFPVVEPLASLGQSLGFILENSVTRSSALDPRSGNWSQPDYVARAKEITTIRSAAFEKRVLNVEALNPIRKDVEERHQNLREQLEKVLLYGVYGVPDNRETLADFETSDYSQQQKSAAELDEDEEILGKSFTPSFPLFPGFENGASVPSPIGFVELDIAVQEALPQIVQALDVLCGAGYAWQTIEKVAARETRAVIEHAIQSELHISGAGSSSRQRFSKEYHSNPADAGCTFFFRRDFPGAAEMMCCATLNRICFHFTATLRRVVKLANAVERQSRNMLTAIISLREQMENSLTFLLKTFLGTGDSTGFDGSVESGAAIEVERGFSLLTSPILPAGAVNNAIFDRDSGSFQPRFSSLLDMERRSSKAWEKSSVHEISGGVECTIFNLELMHALLKRFSRESERLLAPWKAFGEGMSSGNLKNSLLHCLQWSTETFVQTLQQHACMYVRGVVGKRAGSLLQPPPLKSRNSQTEHKPSNLIPPPPHVEPLAHAIAVCIRIAISIPDIAQQIGSIISSEILMALNQRSWDAMKVARKWTDAGCLFQEGFQYHLNVGLQGNTSTVECDLPSPLSPIDQTISTSSADSMEVDPMTGNLTILVQGLLSNGSDAPALLTQNEWKAVVRLIYGLNSITDELEKWNTDSKLSQCTALDTSVSGRWSALSVNKNCCVYPLQHMRQRIRQGTTGTEMAMLSTVCRVLGETRNTMKTVERQVLTPTVSLLRAEIMLRCYWLSVRSLREIETAYVPTMTARKSNTERGDIPWPEYGEDIIMEDEDDDGMEDDECSSRLYEFDEYGDRIPQSSKCIVKDCFADNQDGSFVLDAQSLTMAENRMVEFAREANVELSMRFNVVKSTLPVTQQEEVFSCVDMAIAAGLRSVQRRDRAIAVASRILVQTLAVEDENLVLDRTSEQCRALMYASGML